MNIQNADTKITVFVTTWCGDCRRVLSYLDEAGVMYTAINIDKDQSAAQIVTKLNRGFRSVPTIAFPDGSYLVEPSFYELQKKLDGLKSQAS